MRTRGSMAERGVVSQPVIVDVNRGRGRRERRKKGERKAEQTTGQALNVSNVKISWGLGGGCSLQSWRGSRWIAGRRSLLAQECLGKAIRILRAGPSCQTARLHFSDPPLTRPSTPDFSIVALAYSVWTSFSSHHLCDYKYCFCQISSRVPR